MVTYPRLRDELVAFDAHELGLSFDGPMFFLKGGRGRVHLTSKVEAYAAESEAPRNELVLIEGSGH
jgi:hypothetical protein